MLLILMFILSITFVPMEWIDLNTSTPLPISVGPSQRNDTIQNNTEHNHLDYVNESERINHDYSYLNYGNLSCPFEWSKYSCVWQGKHRLHHRIKKFLPKFLQKLNLTLNIIELLSTKLYDRNVYFIGDSVTRQQFLSLSCMIWSWIQEHKDSGIRILHNIKWSKKWECHNTFNCITSGEHGGFSRLCISVEMDNIIHTNICYLGPFEVFKIYEGLKQDLYTEINNFMKESFGLELKSKDIVIANRGLQGKIHPTHIKVFHLKFAELTTEHNITVIYRQMAPVHFDTDDGTFSNLMGWRGECIHDTKVLNATPVELQWEREILGNSSHLLYWDFDGMFDNLGWMHIAQSFHTTDCTHWCLPGVPDIWNVMLSDELSRMTL